MELRQTVPMALATTDQVNAFFVSSVEDKKFLENSLSYIYFGIGKSRVK